MHLNKDIEEQMEKNGYAIVDFLDESELDALRRIYRKNKPIIWRKPVYCNVYVDNKKKNRRIHQQILEVIGPKVLEILDVSIISACFIVKKAGKENEVGLHQDWTITNEDREESYIIWMPLVDTTVENGAMVCLDRSNRHFANVIRSHNLPSVYLPLDKENLDRSKILTMKAGQALIYAVSLFHGSFRNASKRDRPVALASFVPKGARKYFYYYNEREDKTYKLIMPDNFHLDYQPNLDELELNKYLEAEEVIKGKPAILKPEEVLKHYN